jgi:hypothetical protein
LNQQVTSSLETIHEGALDRLKQLTPEQQDLEIRSTFSELVVTGRFAAFEILAERLKIELFNTMIQSREEAILHELRGAAKGIEDFLAAVFAEAAVQTEDKT